MNKKEIAEVKKQFKKDYNVVDRIAGCLVDGEKKIRMTDNRLFLTMGEDQILKYYEIFKKGMSGGIGRNLYNLDYTIEQELEGEGQKMLLALRDSALKDEELLNQFYQKTIDNYVYGESYYIVLIHGNYDVPGRGKDGIAMEDASDRVYEFICCFICPVELSAAGLYYNAIDNKIDERDQYQWVQPPMNGLLFPAFNDRADDIHSLLYYAKKPTDMHDEYLEGCIGGPTPMSAKVEKETFQDILTETLGNDSAFDVVSAVQEEFSNLMEQHAEDEEPVVLTKSSVRAVLEQSGVEEEKLEQFDRAYDSIAGDKTSFHAENVVAAKKSSIEMNDIKIQIPPDCIGMVSTKVVDGKTCLVIPVTGEVEINGLKTAIGKNDPSIPF